MKQPQQFMRMDRAPTPPQGVPITPRRAPVNGRPDTGRSRMSDGLSGSPVPVPAPTPAQRPASRPRRPPSLVNLRPESEDMSAAYTATAPSEVSTPPSRARPSTESAQYQPPPPSSLRPRQGRRPSNASSAMRSSSATTASQIPSIALPGSPSRAAFPLSTPTNPPPPASAIPITTIPQSQRLNGFQLPPQPVSASLDVPYAASSSLTSSFGVPSPSSAYPQDLETPRPRNLSPSPARSRKYSTGPSDSHSTAPTRQQNARVSFFDPANQAALDRLLSGDMVVRDEKEDEGEDAPVGEETAQAMLASVEEMLEGYELARGDLLGTTGRGTTDQIEARLLDELMALEKVMATHWVPLLRSFRSRYQANIHSFIESDDRVNIVLKFLEDAIGELDSMDSIISSYKIHLNVSDVGARMRSAASRFT